MDPVSALGIASASVQFITFASQLIAATTDIHDSADHAPAYISNLDTVYSQLQRLCQNLSQAAQKAYRDPGAVGSQTTTTDTHHAPPTFDRSAQGIHLEALDGTIQAQLGIGNPLRELQDVYSTLHKVVTECEKDSTHILSLVSSLKLRGGVGSLTKSFKVAFKMMWKKGEIQEVDERLKRSQATLVAMMARISKSAMTTLPT